MALNPARVPALRMNLDELRERARHHGTITRAELAALNRAGDAELVASYARHRDQIVSAHPRTPDPTPPAREPIGYLRSGDL